MSRMAVQSLNENIANERVSKPYPHLMLSDVDNALALVLPAIPTGDLPVLCTHKGVTRQLGSIARSAIEINKLRRIGTVKYVASKEEERSLITVVDIMEVLA